jgi:adenosine deaminase
LQAHYSNQIIFRPELGISKDREIQDVESLVNRCIESGFFFSIDLYSAELAQPPEMYREFYRRAKRAGMKLKAHTGEFGPAEMVRRTVEVLELDEVQHGINAADSSEVMKWLEQNKIRLNVCPTSNVMLNRVPNLRAHPVRKLYDHGVNITINTDDPMIFDQSVSDEYLNLYQAGVFSAEELNDIRKYSLEKTS